MAAARGRAEAARALSVVLPRISAFLAMCHCSRTTWVLVLTVLAPEGVELEVAAQGLVALAAG